jgi:diguanylate cyclase (GGDEF)-like protein
MHFRQRLHLLFVLIVLVPLLSVGLVLFRLIGTQATGESEARLAEAQKVAIALYDEDQSAAAGVARTIATDDQLVAAMRLRALPLVRRRVAQLQERLRADRLIVRRGDDVVADVGRQQVVAAATQQLEAPDLGNLRLGEVTVSLTPAEEYVHRLRAVTGLHVAVWGPDRVRSATLPGLGRPPPPGQRHLKLGSRQYRLSPGFLTVGADGRQQQVALLENQHRVEAAMARGRTLAVGTLLGFLALAFVFAVVVRRSLQAQVGRFLEAARRVGGGDFDARVPDDGRDEFAQLGAEFNRMAAQLQSRVEELARERARRDETVRRTGEAFAASLDRDNLLAIGVQAMADAVGAACGRATAPDGSARQVEVARVGSLAGYEEALHAAEAQALRCGTPTEVTVAGRAALAYPVHGGDERREVIAVLGVVRRDRPFVARERDLFHYLGAQAARSLENASLHQEVQRQAVTDELTGLSNHRRFHELLGEETVRAQRERRPLALLMLDLDDFKAVNDRFGHQHGDLVLREVARVLRESCRATDEPARYGGEELAVALPGMGLRDAVRVGERVRRAIEALVLPLPDGRPGGLQVTASVGVAALPETASSSAELIRAADAALYRAKAAGKNRAERAVPQAVPAA